MQQLQQNLNQVTLILSKKSIFVTVKININKSLKITVLRSECTYCREREPDGLFSNDLHQLGPVARAFIYFQDIADSRSIKFVLNHVRLQRTSLSRFQTVRQSACWNDDGFI